MSALQGLELLGQGRRAEVYSWDEGRALRLYRSGRDPADACREAAAMRAAASAGAPVPRVHDVIEVDGRTGVVMDRVSGPDGLTHMGRRPTSVLSVAATTARVHAQLAAAGAPPSMPSVRDRARRALQSERVPPALAAAAQTELEGLPDGAGLCHGDFHPGNVLLGRDGPVVIDWEGAMRGHPEADHAFTLVLLAAGEPGPGTPLALRVLVKVARRVFRLAYAAEFRRRVSVDPGRIRRWTGVLAAARLSEGIPEERDRVLAIARRALSVGAR